MKRIMPLLLAALLLLSFAGPAAAEERETEIYTAEQFLSFALSCARESYSLEKKFILMQDIDLSGCDYEPAGYFAGHLDGRGHSIRGLALAGEGSRLGLFRMLSPQALVENLHVEGYVRSNGSQEAIGGLAGVNEGTVRGCSFVGDVRGIRQVGGLVGMNSGLVRDCRFSGFVSGEHQTGGVAGLNNGMLLSCSNDGAVNTTAITPSGERRFDLSSLTQDDFVDLSSIAGIAGENTGVLQDCCNEGAVGYSYTGYNVGGVCGKNSGYIRACTNTGSVSGRRDVGGIAGQSIPYAAWELTESQLKDLASAIGTLNALLSRTANDLDGSVGSVKDGLLAMQAYTADVGNALKWMIEDRAESDRRWLEDIRVDPETGEVTLPGYRPSELDTSILSTALGNLYAQAEMVSSSARGGFSGLSEDLHQVTAQISYLFELLFAMLNEADSGDFVSMTDLSFTEAYDHDEGALDGCVNRGAVLAEANAGGVVGTVGFEIEFDMEDRLQSAGYLPSRAERFLFAAVRRCENRAPVESRGDCAGGVVGRMDVGAVVDCISAGAAVSQSGSYVGGIAGRASGTLAGCWVRVSVSGERYVGGVAGLCARIQDCRSWTHIERGSEYLGAVAGWAEDAVSGNLYVAARPEGIDGISRIGQAEPLEEADFLALDGIPQGFDSVTVRFIVGDEAVQTLHVPFGAAIDSFPEVENDGSAYWIWEKPAVPRAYTDLDVRGHYREPNTTISTGEEVPLFLVEGEFYEGQRLHVVPWDGAPEEGERLAGYTLTVNDYDSELTVRMRCGQAARVLVPDGGDWRELSGRWDGQYLVFRLPNGGSFALMTQEKPQLLPVYIGVGAGGLCAVAALLLVRRHRRKQRAAAN